MVKYQKDENGAIGSISEGPDGYLRAESPPLSGTSTGNESVRLDGNIARRRAPKNPMIYWDTDLPGFGLRCRISGHKTWVLRHRERGNARFETLGSTATMDVRQARRKALKILRSSALDGLPQRPVARPSAGLTFEQFFPEFMQCMVGWKASTAKRNAWAIKAHILPSFGALPVAQMTRADIVKWRDAMGQKPAAFNRSVPVLASMFKMAETLGYRLAGSNPCKGIARYRRKLPERYLSGSEYRTLASVLKAAQAEMHEAVSIIRLLMYTGARRQEIAGLRWEWIKPPRIFLPDSKTGAKVIYLSAPARKILDDLRGERISGLVFPGRRNPRDPFNPDPAWSKLRARAGLTDVRLHDLRHSFASLAIRNGVSLSAVGKLLGHALPESTARYAHLADDAVSESAARVCASIADKMELGL
ncbi:tyrosine-type recombinase/integrase [Sphingomonas sp. H39-1-10]|uniref:tyrosine-type recombinase/integrase n=1 Tax=Sphingomonas pollutisoli TaxID=3030829 RepID=UPI0023B9039E|nr:site-specific integrase [Sphingomonas pollutisoli]MDF0486512.1 tyrosine-type recombinase/integrase [Sphingomonas pollutisoli]